MQCSVNPPVSTFAYIFTLGTHVAIYGGSSIKDDSVEKDLWLFDTVTQTYARCFHRPFLRSLSNGCRYCLDGRK